jgi:hypothetical protein
MTWQLVLIALLFPSIAFAANNPAVTINVDATANRHPIDPRIYGVAFADTATINDLGITINRWGGNAMSRYNWAISTANRAKDYYFENIQDPVAGAGNSADDFIAPTLAAGAQPIMTIPMMGWLPKDAEFRCSFPVNEFPDQQYFDGNCGNGKRPDETRILGENDPNETSAQYTSAYQADWVQHNIDNYGRAGAGGVRYYSLDNEPGLWSFDHWDVHPTGSTYDEVWGKMAEYGAAIKAKDPAAVITGIEEWGWDGYFESGLDNENHNSNDRDLHAGVPYAEWLLKQAKAYEDAHHQRIVDFATVHFYPQGGEFDSNDELLDATKELRNRSTRSLWDPTYQDESWIGGTGIDGGHVRLIPRLKEWVANNYPGTKIGITEYNWGAENDPNGATAQADILGIFAREALDLGVRWTSPLPGSNVYNAFKMYRNYDGAHHGFGDTSVGDAVPDPDTVSSFAAVRSSDGALTIVIVAKYLANATPVTINLAHFTAAGTAVQRWQLDATNTISHVADVTRVGATVSLTVPAESVTMLIVPGTVPAAPASITAAASSASTVAVTWPAVGGATGYEVFRSSNRLEYSFAGSSATAAFNDAGLTADTTYLYKVRSLISGNTSPFTGIDPATTTMFTNDPLTAGIVIKAAHVNELRTAVNAMRATAGLLPQVFTGGTVIQAVHLTQLRSALNEARTTLGLTPTGFADATITPHSTKVKAAQFVEIRNGVK